MDVERAAIRVGARPLARVRIQIDPTFVEGTSQDCRVLGAKRRQRDTGMFGPSRAISSAEEYLRAFEKNRTFCTSLFIVVPNVRLKAPSAWKNADITFSRSLRFGTPRSVLNAAASSFAVLRSVSVTVG